MSDVGCRIWVQQYRLLFHLQGSWITTAEIRCPMSEIKKASSGFFKSSVEVFSLCNATKRILSRQNKYGLKKRDPSVIAWKIHH